jgi:peptide/nickel transport system permease protein
MPITSQYLLKRAIYMLLSVLGVSIVGFALFRLLPGDPVELMVGPGYFAKEEMAALRARLGLDQPIYIQYFIWLRDFLSGNFGRSFRFDLNVLDLIMDRLPATLELIIFSVIIALIIGVAIGVVSAVKPGSWADRVSQTTSFVGFAIPHFLWGIIFVVVFSAALRILPASGRLDMDIEVNRITGFMLIDTLLQGNVGAFANSLIHLILPGLALSMGLIAMIHRTLRSSMLDVLSEDYIFTDRMKGLSERYIIYVRALKNALMPVITIVGIQFTFLLGGSILVEKIYGWPGLGNLVFTAVQYQDLSLVQGIIMIYAIIVVLTNFVVDLIYTLVNPRVEFK